MREFGKGPFTLRHAARPLRLVYGGFLLLVAAGVATQLAFHIGRIGLTPSEVATYYRGSDAGEVMRFPKTPGQLLELTHAHAFTMAVIYLVLAHLFGSTRAPATFRAVVLVVAFAGTAGDLVAPWLIRYGAAWCAWIALAAWAAQATGTLLMLGVSAWECLGIGESGQSGHETSGGSCSECPTPSEEPSREP